MADAPCRRRWPRRLFISSIAVLLFLYFVPTIVARSGLIQRSLNSALMDFNGSVTIGSASLGWFSPVELRDVVVKDDSGREMASIPKVTTSKSLFQLAVGRSDLGMVMLEKAAVEIICENNVTNLETSLSKIFAKPGVPNAKVPTVKLKADHASLTIKEPATRKEWNFAIACGEFEIDDVFKVKLQIDAPNLLDCELSIGTRIVATGNATAFPIDVATPFLKRFEPELDLQGKLSGQVSTDQTERSIRIGGAFTIDQFKAGCHFFGNEQVSLEKLDIPFEVSFDGSRIDVHKARLSCSLGSATFVGVFDSAKPFEQLVHQPGVQASLHVELAKVAKVLPRLLNLRPGTDLSAGTFEAHLASTPAGNGAVWSGQCKATALEGAREGKPLSWEQPIVATFSGQFDDRFRPDFESLRVASDFASINARGKLENFNADADVSLDILARHLAEFVDLDGTVLKGTAKLKVESPPQAGDWKAIGSLNMKQLAAENRAFRFAGEGTLNWNLIRVENVFQAEITNGVFSNIRFRGIGVDVDEPTFEIPPTKISYDSAKNKITVPLLQFRSQTLAAAISNLTFENEAVSFQAAINANLARVQKSFAIPGDPIRGTLRSGTIDVSMVNGEYLINAKLPIDNFQYGSGPNPVWSEPKLTASVIATHMPQTDLVNFEEISLVRPDGIALLAKGSASDFHIKPRINLSGLLKYDLAAFEPQFKEHLGKSFKAAGKDNRPFHLKGTLDDLSLLVGDATLGWQSISAYGFDIGKSQLDAKLEGGNLMTNTIEATFATTGKVKLQPTICLQSKTYDLVFAKGRLIEKATITPAACADAIGFALPAIAKSTQAEGTFSFDLDDHHIPLMDIKSTRMNGKLTLHNVNVIAGPVISEIAALFGQQQPKLALMREQVVAVRVDKGLVYHENLNCTFNKFDISTSGSVSFEGALNLIVTVPIPENAIAPLLKNAPAIRDAIAKKRFTIPITGTLAQPRLDKAAFNAAVAKFIKDVSRDAARSKLEEFLKPKRP